MSQCIAGVAYDPRTFTLTIDFEHGGSYEYYLVPPDIYAGVVAGGGEFFNTSIRNVFPGHPVGDGSSALLTVLKPVVEDVAEAAAEGLVL